MKAAAPAALSNETMQCMRQICDIDFSRAGSTALVATSVYAFLPKDNKPLMSLLYAFSDEFILVASFVQGI